MTPLVLYHIFSICPFSLAVDVKNRCKSMVFLSTTLLQRPYLCRFCKKYFFCAMVGGEKWKEFLRFLKCALDNNPVRTRLESGRNSEMCCR